jgi:hypothetical protein
MRGLLPREHGAYGQVTLPLVTAFIAVGVSTSGLLFTAAVVAAFLAHEPTVVLLGHRGPRARREFRGSGLRWLVLCGAAGVATGIGALLVMEPETRWSVAVPLVPAVVLAVATVLGREKSWYGEVAAALAFSAAAIPVSLAAGATVDAALSVAIPFALLFVASTLAVRVVILRVRGGGDQRAVTTTRTAALMVVTVATASLCALIATAVLSASALVAATPGLLTAVVITSCPPAATRLGGIGWSLVAVSVLTAAIVIATVQ